MPSCGSLALPAAAWSFVTVRVMHRLSVKLLAVFRRMFPALREPPVVAFSKVKTMIDMPVEMFRPVKPRSGSDKYPV
jgi:hypothetical protein